MLVLTEPSTGVPLPLYKGQDPSGVEGYTPLRPTKLGHVAAFTPDLTSLQAFYEDLLGFRWSDTVGDFFVFLRCNADHHAANFMASSKFSGMHHVAYEMRDPAHLITLLDHLAKENYRLIWGPGRHGPGHNLFTYHKDPDGNTVELFTQLDVMHDDNQGYWEPRPWHESVPLHPRTWEVGWLRSTCGARSIRSCLITDAGPGSTLSDARRPAANGRRPKSAHWSGIVVAQTGARAVNPSLS